MSSRPRTRTPVRSESPKRVSDRPNLALPRSDLDVLMTTLDVDVIGLIECLVSPGWRLSFGSADAPAIHYNLRHHRSQADRSRRRNELLALTGAASPYKAMVITGDCKTQLNVLWNDGRRFTNPV